MADPWMTSQDDEVPPKPFDRRALQATLADAVRTVETPEMPDAAPASPTGAAAATAPTAPTTATTPATASLGGLATGGTIGAPPQASKAAKAPANPPAARAPKPPANPTAAANPAAAAAPAPAAGARPLNPFGRVQVPGESGSILGGGAPARLVPGAASPAPGSLGGLRATNPENLGPINFSGSSAPLPDLSGGRAVSGLAETPVDRPTIPLRRPPAKPVESPADSAAAAPAAPGGPPAPRAQVTIEAWNPSDDDILPPGGVKRKSFRFARQ